MGIRGLQGVARCAPTPPRLAVRASPAARWSIKKARSSRQASHLINKEIRLIQELAARSLSLPTLGKQALRDQVELCVSRSSCQQEERRVPFCSLIDPVSYCMRPAISGTLRRQRPARHGGALIPRVLKSFTKCITCIHKNISNANNVAVTSHSTRVEQTAAARGSIKCTHRTRATLADRDVRRSERENGICYDQPPASRSREAGKRCPVSVGGTNRTLSLLEGATNKRERYTLTHLLLFDGLFEPVNVRAVSWTALLYFGQVLQHLFDPYIPVLLGRLFSARPLCPPFYSYQLQPIATNRTCQSLWH